MLTFPPAFREDDFSAKKKERVTLFEIPRARRKKTNLSKGGVTEKGGATRELSRQNFQKRPQNSMFKRRGRQ